MGQLTLTHNDTITLTSGWSCTIVYLYNSTGSFNGVSSRSQTTPKTVTSSVKFTVDLPVGAEMIGAKVHATYEIKGRNGQFLINNIEPDADGFAILDVADFSSSDVEVEFSWKANPDSRTSHDSTNPTYNGNSSQSKTYWHSSDVEIKQVDLLVEYKMNGLIYRAVGDKLVPYQIYHAENEKLVPYQLFKAVDNALVRY